MGTKGAELTNAASTSADRLQADLSGLGEISIRKMFGGYGVFESGTMFALVDVSICTRECATCLQQDCTTSLHQKCTIGLQQKCATCLRPRCTTIPGR
jgi:hypothetical protein